MPDEDLAGEMYELMLEKLAEKNYQQYEISNFARAGFESKHNSKYWLCEPVFAFGVSAHSFDGKDRRYSNERDTAKYVELIERNESPVVEMNELTNAQMAGDYAFLHLRRSEGINLTEFVEKFGIDLKLEFAEDLERLESFGLIEFSAGHLRLTKKGKLYSNEVFAVFV